MKDPGWYSILLVVLLGPALRRGGETEVMVECSTPALIQSWIRYWRGGETSNCRDQNRNIYDLCDQPGTSLSENFQKDLNWKRDMWSGDYLVISISISVSAFSQRE